MKTIKKQRIGAHEVVGGFDILPVDPELTRQRNIKELKKTTEQADFVAKQGEYDVCYRNYKKHEGNAKALYGKKVVEICDGDLVKAAWLKRDDVLDKMSAQERSALDTEERLMKGYEGKGQVIESELESLFLKLRAKESELAVVNTVFSEPRANEVSLPEAEVDDLIQKHLAKTDKQQLLLDGAYIEDFRGTYYVCGVSGEWSTKEITELGILPAEGDILESDLTEEQREDIRIQGMTTEEKNIEKAARIEEAKNSAAHMLNVLTIEDDPDATTKARDWYSAEVVKIEDKYS